MFNNIGGKIKTLANVLTIIGIIISLILGCLLMAGDGDLAIVGLLVMVIGSLCAWLSSFLLYGFGQLIENSDRLVGNLPPIGKSAAAAAAPAQTSGHDPNFAASLAKAPTELLHDILESQNSIYSQEELDQIREELVRRINSQNG